MRPADTWSLQSNRVVLIDSCQLCHCVSTMAPLVLATSPQLQFRAPLCWVRQPSEGTCRCQVSDLDCAVTMKWWLHHLPGAEGTKGWTLFLRSPRRSRKGTRLQEQDASMCKRYFSVGNLSRWALWKRTWRRLWEWLSGEEGCKIFHGMWPEMCIAHCTVNTGLKHTGDSVLASYLTPAESSEPSMTDGVLAFITSQLGQIATSFKPQVRREWINSICTAS